MGRLRGSVDRKLPSVRARMEDKISPEPMSGCHLWTGSVDKKGYGRISIGGRAGRPVVVSRVAWELARGPIPAGLCALHKCDNPACANVEHLFLGTRAENNADMRAKGRAKIPTGGRRFPSGPTHPNWRHGRYALPL